MERDRSESRGRENERGKDSGGRGCNGENEAGVVIDCVRTWTIIGGWSHVSGLNSPFASHNESDVAVGSI